MLVNLVLLFFNSQGLIFKGCWLGRIKLLKYYKKTDSSNVYPIATFCDSSIKNRFWIASNWGEYGLAAMNHVEDEWNQDYKPFVYEDTEDNVEYETSDNIFARIALDLQEEIEAERDVNDDELELYKRERPASWRYLQVPIQIVLVDNLYLQFLVLDPISYFLKTMSM